MNREYFEFYIWPHMFYMGPEMMWKWKMNAARAMGNSLDEAFVPDLVSAIGGKEDERVQCMAVWALGRIGGSTPGKHLRDSCPGLRIHFA